MRTLFLTLLLVGSGAWAKAWNGIDPGVSRRDEVIQKFGPPSKTMNSGGKELLAYLGKNAIKGTRQTQFQINAQTQVVERIYVFPGPVIDRDAVENSYGPACGDKGAGPDCYVKRITDDFRTYFDYARTGLVVFFSEDGKTVQSFSFQPPKPGKAG